MKLTTKKTAGSGDSMSSLVRSRLRELGRTQEWLASRVGVSAASLSRQLHLGRPDYSTLEHLSQALGCLPGDLLPHTDSLSVRCPHCGGRVRVVVSIAQE